jgi:hypothetical protein
VAVWDDDVQQVETEYGAAVNYVGLTGLVSEGDSVLLNRTARVLSLGTGGFDFVMANLSASDEGKEEASPGHIIKARYLPSQHSVLTLEEQDQYAQVWTKPLDGFPVIVGQLHSQLAPAAFALAHAGLRVAYVMTDAAALAAGFSKLVRRLREKGILAATITSGQASGGDFETVTVHSALIAAKHVAHCDAAIVIQGPGNAGTGTKYGFSGIEQAAHLNTTAALGCSPVALARMSDADPRERHRGVSHHTITSLELTLAPCTVAVPFGTDTSQIPAKHRVVEVAGASDVLQAMVADGVSVTSMGRSVAEDPLFFAAAAAAGIYAAMLARK